MATVSSQSPHVEPTLADDSPGLTERRVAAWVGTALRIEGRIISAADLTIDGNVEGSIDVGDRNLIIRAGASVKADLSARNITIHGSVVGNVRASEMVDLRATGSVIGDISGPRVVLAEGAAAKGRIEAG
jgi:cytoskeletal protein CcmA (bactofilin family)